MTEVERIAKRMTPLRLEALDEIARAGEAGLGFGRCSLHKRRELLKWGLTERLPAGGMFHPIREKLTPLGLAVRDHIGKVG